LAIIIRRSDDFSDLRDWILRRCDDSENESDDLRPKHDHWVVKMS